MLDLDIEETLQQITKDENYNIDQRNFLKHAVEVLRICVTNQYGPLITGTAGKKDEFGLYDYYFVTPKYGMTGLCVYKKNGDYKEPSFDNQIDKNRSYK